jgi:alginate O-acetyltransferase complex protein AlgI
MSLSSWFRDYLYVPLGGNRHGAVRTYRNLAIVFLLCGFWHGAAWTFVAWGAWHGALLIAERAGLRALLTRLPDAVQHLYLLLTVVLGWVLFRAEDMPHAWAIYRALAGDGGSQLALDAVLTPSVLLAFVVGGAIATARFELPPRLAPRLAMLRAPAALAALLLCACSLSAGTYNPFIYFRF